MKFALASIAVMSGAVAGPAYAQVADVAPFTGPRIEFFAGWDRSNPHPRAAAGALNYASTSQAVHHTGAVAGIGAGYDYPLGANIIVGILGSYAIQTPNGCGDLTGLNRGCLRPGRQIEGGARIGFHGGDRFLIYAKGAYVNTSINTNVQDGPIVRYSWRNRSGYRAGAGVEYALNRHAYLKAEYDYTRANAFDSSPYGIPNTRVRYDFNQAVAGFGIRF